MRKLGFPQKTRTVKTGMGNSTGNANKKTTKTSQNDKKNERGWNKLLKKGTGNRGKITVQLEEINQNVLAKEGRLKRYRQRVKQYRQNRTSQNNERKFYQRLGGSDRKTYELPDAKETERFWTKIWQPKNITKMLNG